MLTYAYFWAEHHGKQGSVHALRCDGYEANPPTANQRYSLITECLFVPHAKEQTPYWVPLKEIRTV